MKWYEYTAGVGALAGLMAGWVYFNKADEPKEAKESAPKVKWQGAEVSGDEIKAMYSIGGKQYVGIDISKDGSLDRLLLDGIEQKITEEHRNIYKKFREENVIVK